MSLVRDASGETSVTAKRLRIQIGWVAAILFCISFPRALYAVDVLSQFNVTIQKLEISKDGGRTYFTVFEGNTTPVNLVALSGQGVGTLLGEANVPAGTYTRSRVTISAVTLVFTVDGTGATGGTNLGGGTTGTLTINIATTAGAPALPLLEEKSMNVSCKHNGTVNAVINFDAATSFSGLTYTDNDGVGAGTAVTLTGLTFDPVVEVVE